jgi:YVTN family beta-propeller protein
VRAGGTRAVFLSYRREETRHIAGRLADRLSERIGREQVFMDVDTIEAGADFTAAIAREVASCNVLIALIGPTWLTKVNQRGQRKIDDPDDIVALEIRAALEREIHVIPVLVDGAVMPNREDLPKGLQDLIRRTAVRLDHDTFHSDITILLNAVDRILLTLAQKVTEQTGGAHAGFANRAIATNKDHPQQTPEANRLGGPLAGQGNAAGAHHPSLSTPPPTPPSSTPWLRSRSRLLITAVIVITAVMAGGIALFATINPPRSGAPSLTTSSPQTVPSTVPVAPDRRGSSIINHDSGVGSVDHPGAGGPPLAGASSPQTLTSTVPQTVTSTVPVGKHPSIVAVAPNGRRVYVTNYDSGSVSVIDADSNTVTATVPVGNGPSDVVVSPDGHRIYVTNHDSDSVSVIDTKAA